MLLKQVFQFQPATVLLWAQAIFLLLLLSIGFQNNAIIGFGRCFYANGDYYNGKFKNGKLTVWAFIR